MEDIKFNSLVHMVNFFSDAKVLGIGFEGTCYKRGNKTYKLYNELYSESFDNYVSRLKLLKFKDIIINNIYFIRSLIYYNDSIIGSVSEYASGSSCGRISFNRVNLDKLVLALNTLKNNIYELSKLGIYIQDEFLDNMLYDGNAFKLIDTGGYFYSSELLESEVDGNKDDFLVIYKINMKKIVKLLFGRIFDKNNGCSSFIFSFLCDIDSPYKDCLVDTDLMMEPDMTVVGIRDTVEEMIGRKILSFGNCRKDLMKVRKKR